MSNRFVELKNYIKTYAPTCIHTPVVGMKSNLKFRYSTPTSNVSPGADDNCQTSLRSTQGYYLQMYDWDSCFFAQAMTYLGIDYLIEDTVANFLSLKQSDGYIPRTISPDKIWDVGDACKPFLAQTLNFGRKKYLNKDYSKYLDDLDCYLEYFNRTRLDKSGLYVWRNVLESGVDDNLALIYPLEAGKEDNRDKMIIPDGKVLAVDLSCYLYGEFCAMVDLSQASNNNILYQKYLKLANDLKYRINNVLYNANDSFYYNILNTTNEFIKIKSWTSLLPVTYGICNEEIGNKIIESYILASSHFNQLSGISSMSKAEVLYNQAKRGLYGRAIVSNWQGPVWVLPNALIIRHLIQTKYNKQAIELANKILTTVQNGIKKYGTMYENYDANSGEPLWAPNFMSWNSLCLELIEYAS